MEHPQQAHGTPTGFSELKVKLLENLTRIALVASNIDWSDYDLIWVHSMVAQERCMLLHQPALSATSWYTDKLHLIVFLSHWLLRYKAQITVAQDSDYCGIGQWLLVANSKVMWRIRDLITGCSSYRILGTNKSHQSAGNLYTDLLCQCIMSVVHQCTSYQNCTLAPVSPLWIMIRLTCHISWLPLMLISCFNAFKKTFLFSMLVCSTENVMEKACQTGTTF